MKLYSKRGFGYVNKQKVGSLIVCDINDPNSLEETFKWKSFIEENNDQNNILFMLVLAQLVMMKGLLYIVVQKFLQIQINCSLVFRPVLKKVLDQREVNQVYRDYSQIQYKKLLIKDYE